MSDNIPNDPFADRESQNYENPIPSREFILEFLEQAGVPMNRNDLFEALKLAGEEQYERVAPPFTCHGTRWSTGVYTPSVLRIA